MAAYPRRVTGIDQEGLELAQQARRLEPASMLLLTPTGGLAHAARTPMNVGACFADGRLAWALPLDLRRLTLAPTDADTAALFRACWRALDGALAGPESPATIWEPPTAVGTSPDEGDSWVEYQKPRPWVELGSLADGARLLVPLTASLKRSALSRLQYDVSGGDVRPVPGARILHPVDVALELAHFAVLAPAREPGWRVAGKLAPHAVIGARIAFAEFPQRDDDGHVQI